METIEFKYYMSCVDHSNEIAKAKRMGEENRKALEAYAKTLGADMFCGYMYADCFEPIELIFSNRMHLSWLCKEQQDPEGWIYRPKQNTKKGKEIYDTLEKMNTTHEHGYLLKVASLDKHYAFGWYKGGNKFVYPLAITDKQKRNIYIKVPVTLEHHVNDILDFIEVDEKAFNTIKEEA